MVAILVATLLFASGQSWDGSLFAAGALATLFVVAAQLWTPFPTTPDARALADAPSGPANAGKTKALGKSLYAEILSLRCAWRPAYASGLLAESVLRFPWIPSRSEDIAGYVDKDRFLLKRMTFWANGARPTAFGRLRDASPGTEIDVTVATPAATVYFLIGLLLLHLCLFVLILLGSLGVAGRTYGGAFPFAVVGGTGLVVLLLGVVASPVPIGRGRSESDRYVAFFDEALGATLISRA